MGNLFSDNNPSEENNKKIIKMKEILNNITLYYINNTTFNDMIKLNSPEYCNKLTILTKDIINKYMTTIQVENLYQEIDDKKEPIEMVFGYNNSIETNKDKMCSKIAEHYVLILHIFNLIKKIFLINDYNNGTKVQNNVNERIDDNLCTVRHKQINNEIATDVSPDIDDLENFYKLKYDSNVNDVEITSLKNKIQLSDKFKNQTVQGNNNNDIMVRIIMSSQIKLIEIIDNIFENKEKTLYAIKKDLTNQKLINLADKTKEIITNMYMNCETEYYKFMTENAK